MDVLRKKRAESIYQAKLAEGRALALQLGKDKGIVPSQSTVENFALGYVAGFLAGQETTARRFQKLQGKG